MATTTEHHSHQGIVVVTGASTGIGAATARELARRGFHVLAGVRRDRDADALRTANVEPVMLDITEEAGIAALVRRIADDPERRRLRALVNNAGMAVNAPLETYPLSAWRRLFEVNLFGHVAMTQALLPALIESRGTIVNISSVGGKVAMATYGPYAGTKFALEAVSDSLRREASPEDAGRVIADAIVSRRPRARYTVGRGTATIVRLTRLLSDRMLDGLLARNLKTHFPAA